MRGIAEGIRGRIALGVLVLVVALLVAVVATHRGSASSGAQRAATGGAREGAAQRVSPARPPQGGVVLPEAGVQAGGMPTRFPHTDLGAVAAQAAVARLQLGFDYSQAEQVARHYAPSSDTTALVARSRSAVTQRRQQAGLTTGTSSTPAPAAYAVTPVAYVVRKLEDDYYAVSLLSYVTLTKASGASADSYYSGTSLVRWEDGDWKVAAGSTADVATLTEDGIPASTTPGSAEYRSAGWLSIRQGDQ